MDAPINWMGVGGKVGFDAIKHLFILGFLNRHKTSHGWIPFLKDLFPDQYLIA